MSTSLLVQSPGTLTLVQDLGRPASPTSGCPSRARRTHGVGAAFHVPGGATLEVLAPQVGLRSWLAVRGGLRPTAVLGSASTDLLSGLGAPLAAGDVLPVGPVPDRAVPAIDQAPLARPTADTVELRAVLGPRDDWFTAAAVASLSGAWSVDPRSNRVGLRLQGRPLARHRHEELASEGAVVGSIQIAANGLPVLFLATIRSPVATR